MKNLLWLSIAITLSSISISSHAGFFGSFFANVASDSLQSNGRSIYKTQEMKIQATLGVMALYDGKLDGDLDTFDSRVAIKKFQKKYNLETTGLLSDTERNQLVYLSNLYVSLQKKGTNKSKKLAIYDEIDSTTESMTKKSLVDEYLPFLSDKKNKLRVMSELEDASVYLDGKEVGLIQLGYFTIRLDAGEYDLKILKKEEFFDFSTNKKITIVDKNSATTFQEKEDKVANNKALEIAKSLGLNDYPVDGILVDFDNKVVWENNPSTFTNKVTWYQAKDRCEQLNISIYSNWRLAEIKELHQLYQLVNGSRTIETAHIQKGYSYNNGSIWSKRYKKQKDRQGAFTHYGYLTYNKDDYASHVIHSESVYNSKTKGQRKKTRSVCILDI